MDKYENRDKDKDRDKSRDKGRGRVQLIRVEVKHQVMHSITSIMRITCSIGLPLRPVEVRSVYGWDVKKGNGVY